MDPGKTCRERQELGVNHQVVGKMPAGTLVTTSNCVPCDDRISGARWCKVNWQGIRGRAAGSGLLPINAATTPTKMTHVSTALDLWVLCAANPDTALWVFARAFLPRDAHGSQRA